MNSVVVRKPLPLTERDLAALTRLRASGPHREALTAMAGVDPAELSDEALLRAVLDIGFRALVEWVELEGYAAMAADPELNLQEHRAMARHRVPDWAHE